MELKHQYSVEHNQSKHLLIVPYGIETHKLVHLFRQIFVLLIVPYGIETEVANITSLDNPLLIVPYGIETNEEQR